MLTKEYSNVFPSLSPFLVNTPWFQQYNFYKRVVHRWCSALSAVSQRWTLAQVFAHVGNRACVCTAKSFLPACCVSLNQVTSEHCTAARLRLAVLLSCCSAVLTSTAAVLLLSMCFTVTQVFFFLLPQPFPFLQLSDLLVFLLLTWGALSKTVLYFDGKWAFFFFELKAKQVSEYRLTSEGKAVRTAWEKQQFI